MRIRNYKGPSVSRCVECDDNRKDQVEVWIGGIRICLCTDCAKDLSVKLGGNE